MIHIFSLKFCEYIQEANYYISHPIYECGHVSFGFNLPPFSKFSKFNISTPLSFFFRPGLTLSAFPEILHRYVPEPTGVKNLCQLRRVLVKHPFPPTAPVRYSRAAPRRVIRCLKLFWMLSRLTSEVARSCKRT